MHVPADVWSLIDVLLLRLKTYQYELVHAMYSQTFTFYSLQSIDTTHGMRNHQSILIMNLNLKFWIIFGIRENNRDQMEK